MGADTVEIVWSAFGLLMLAGLIAGVAWFVGYLRDTRNAARKTLEDRSTSATHTPDR